METGPGAQIPATEAAGPDSTALWPFVLRLYGSAGVPEACLALQDDAAADVTLLLFAAWSGAMRGWRMEDAAAHRAAAEVADWHAEVVRPLRAVRRKMKQGPAPAPSPGTEALRDRLKAVEIGAERIELLALEPLAPRGAPPPAAEAAAVVLANLRAMMAAFGVPAPSPDNLTAMTTLAAAAATVAGVSNR